jgi:5-methylcytosine-specific restriction endonuclease McrA
MRKNRRRDYFPCFEVTQILDYNHRDERQKSEIHRSFFAHFEKRLCYIAKMENELRELERKVRTFNDESLHRSTKESVQEERSSTLRVLVHLREIERRNIYFVEGCNSLFAYCIRILGYSESETNRRIGAMRLMREHPELEEKLKDGKVSMTALNQASTFMNREEKSAGPIDSDKKGAILKAIEEKSTAAIDRTLLGLAADPEVHVKKKKDGARPISPTLTQIHFTADEHMRQECELLRGLLGHQNAELSWGELMAEAVRIALDKLDPARRKVRPKKAKAEPAPERENTEATPSDIPSPAKVEPRSLSAAQRREIFRRDGSQCTYVDPKSGRRCPSRYQLEPDHIVPYAHGGPTTLSNMRLLCSGHHKMATLRAFGSSKIELEIAARRVPH